MSASFNSPRYARGEPAPFFAGFAAAAFPLLFAAFTIASYPPGKAALKAADDLPGASRSFSANSLSRSLCLAGTLTFTCTIPPATCFDRHFA